MRRFILNISFLLATTSALYSQNVKVTSSFDSARIYIGDQINFIVTIQQPANINLTLPVFKDSLMKNIEILSGPVFDSTQSGDGTINVVEKYLITSFDSGFYQVPPVYAELKSDEGIKRFYSDYSQLEVMRIKIAPADTAAKIYDIISPYRAPITLGEIIPWVLVLLLLSVLIWAGIRLLKRLRKKKSGVEEAVIIDPAHVIAFRELEILKNDQVWQKGEIKQYYTRLTGILRQYLENRYGVFSLEMTTAETLEALVKTGFKKDKAYNQLKSILTGADLVKFAKHKPDPVENDLHFQNSWNFVLVTRQEEKVFEAGESSVTREEDKV
jgi:hypothetical protein